MEASVRQITLDLDELLMYIEEVADDEAERNGVPNPYNMAMRLRHWILDHA